MNAQVDASANGEGWKRADWTLRYPELDTGPVSFEDAISPEFYELEREAVFRRRWLCVGHVSDVPKVGSYFTKDLEVLDTSIVVVRSKDDTIRAFHNICPHRGNKLVWNENPMYPASGVCRLFRCKYHGWTFDLEGNCNTVSDAAAFFNLDKSELGLNAVHCSVWKGFIFVNFSATPPWTLEEQLGELGAGLGDMPLERCTFQFKYSQEINCNWKIVYDAFLETYHAPYLHAGLRSDIESGAVQNHVLHFAADSMGNRKASYFIADSDYMTPVQKALRADLFGLLDAPDFGYRSMEDLPPGLNPARHPRWGLDSINFHPNLDLLVWRRNWVHSYQFWPLGHNRTRFDAQLRFVPPKNARQRAAMELARIAYKDFALQDANLLQGTFQMLKSRVRNKFYLSDEEFQVRHLHSTVIREVEQYKASLAAEQRGGR